MEQGPRYRVSTDQNPYGRDQLTLFCPSCVYGNYLTALVYGESALPHSLEQEEEHDQEQEQEPQYEHETETDIETELEAVDEAAYRGLTVKKTKLGDNPGKARIVSIACS